ncbi:MAG: GDP-mannose 4,6-dehydratase [Desulfarculaceae bacterium]|nr:GDP-mannose 4,6-dehydratase [Desulfarculaceae bacterium]
MVAASRCYFKLDLDKRSLVTGITGQDGAYLAELLLPKGYEVWGIIRRSSSFSTGRIDHLYHPPQAEGAHLRLVYGDLADASSINQILMKVQPTEIYNLGAQSHVKVSFDVPEHTCDTGATGETHSVRDFVEAASGYVGLDWHDYVEIDPRYFRPAEVEYLKGDPDKAKRQLGWEPKVSFDELVRMMVDSDMQELEKG